MTFLDTGIMVGAVLKSHPEHEACLAALEDADQPFTNAHALAESFATLTGFYKVPVEVATELILSLRGSLVVEALTLKGLRNIYSRGTIPWSHGRRYLRFPARNICPS